MSSTTVSRYLNGSLGSPETARTAVEEATTALSYHPTPLGPLTERRPHWPHIRAAFFAALVAAMENAAHDREKALATSVTLNRLGCETSVSTAFRIGM